MNSSQFVRLNLLSEKAFAEVISLDELNEYILLLDEKDVIDESIALDEPTYIN